MRFFIIKATQPGRLKKQIWVEKTLTGKKSIYLEVIAVVHYNMHDDVIHACVSKDCVSSK